MKRTRIGIIGCGWFVHFYLKALPALAERMQVLWVADPTRERAESVGQKIGVRALTDYRAGLDQVDAVFVLVPHHLHHSITLDCLRAGCHVLVEKPIAVNLEQADEMIATAKSKNRTLMVAYPLRYLEHMQLFKQVVLGGRYGKLIMLDGMMDESWKGYALGWIAKKETLGGGIFFSSSSHMLDIMLWIAGDVQTAAMVGAHGGLPMEGEDTACSVIKFKSGVVGVTRHTCVSPHPRILYTMHAICEKAHLTLTTTPVGDFMAQGADCPWHTRIVALGESEEVLLDSSKGLEVGPEVGHFLDCIESGRTPQTDGPTARKVTELILTAYRDAERSHANS